ncbi:hypothetical protein M8R20_07870 [Pseudomonas sp. R2.Fl]|nr:hypothetical protein [Pseudomonas sp. R2.Fl]
MNRLEQLEKIVRELPPEEFEAFSRWFEELSAERWDRQLEHDSKSGKLDAMTEAAITAFRSGRTGPL